MKKFIFTLCALSLFVSSFSDVRASDDEVFKMSDTDDQPRSATLLTEVAIDEMLEDERDSGTGVVSQGPVLAPAAKNPWVKAKRPPIKLAARRKSQNPLEGKGRDDEKGEIAVAAVSLQPSEVSPSPNADKKDEEGEVFPIDFRIISCLKDWGDGTPCPLPYKFLFNEETFKGITPQPSMSELKNKVGKELLKWHEKRWEYWKPLRDAILLKERTRERLQRKQRKQAAENILIQAQKNDEQAGQALEAIKEKYRLLHPKLIWDEMQRDFVDPKPIKLERAYFSSKPKVSFESRRLEKPTKGLVITDPVDLDIATSMLEILVQEMPVEQQFFNEVCRDHRFKFLPQVTGWIGTLPLKNWWWMSDTISRITKDIYGRYSIPFFRTRERDETTDQGYALAKFNKDQLGLYRRTIWSKITRFDKLIAQRERKGLAAVEVVDHRVFVMDELLDNDAPIDNTQIVIDVRYKMLPVFIEKEKASLVQTPIHFLNVFNGGVVDEVRLMPDPVTLHRTHFIDILEEFHQGQSKLLLRRGQSPTLSFTPNDAPHLSYQNTPELDPLKVEKYCSLLGRYDKLLKEQRKICTDLMKGQFDWSTIPSPMGLLDKKFQPELSRLPRIKSEVVNLKGLEFTDKDLIVQEWMGNGPGRAYTLCYIPTINLSHNLLVNPDAHVFSTHISHLDLSNNQLKSLNCLRNILPQLRSLNVAGNRLEKLSPFGEIPCCLEKLNVSRNQLDGKKHETTSILGQLTGLLELDISDNAFDNLASLSSLRILTFLNVTNVGLQGALGYALPELRLLITFQGKGNPNLQMEPGPKNTEYFRETFPTVQEMYPQIQSFETDKFNFKRASEGQIGSINDDEN